jgi:hypothetical protein
MRKIPTTVGACALAACLALGPVPPASAHEVTASETVFFNPVVCVQGEASIGDGATGGGESRATTWSMSSNSYEPGEITPCSVDVNRPAGQIATRLDLWVWRDSSASWALCREMKGWAVNPVLATGLRIETQWSAPCGPGYYATESRHAVWSGGGYGIGPSVWLGKDERVWSGWWNQYSTVYYHYLPTSATPTLPTPCQPGCAESGPGRTAWGPPDKARIPASGVLSTGQYYGAALLVLGPDAFRDPAAGC